MLKEIKRRVIHIESAMIELPSLAMTADFDFPLTQPLHPSYRKCIKRLASAASVFGGDRAQERCVKHTLVIRKQLLGQINVLDHIIQA